MRPRAALTLLLAGCGGAQGWDPGNPPACDPRTLAAGEVRARHIWCTSELVSGGDGRTGDWMLENAVARYAIRGDYAPLTRLHGAGGTLVDAAGSDGVDALTEATPLFGDAWFDDVEITAWNLDDEAGFDLVGTLPDGEQATLTWSLQADEPTLRWTGATGLLLVPTAGSHVAGAFVEAGADAGEPGLVPVLGLDGAPEDGGGWLRYDDVSAITVGSAEDVAAALWPTGVAVSGTSEGEFVQVTDEADRTLLRLPVRDGAFSGVVPVSARALSATAPGYAYGPTAAPNRDLALTLGGLGALRVRVADQDGVDIPATLWFDGEPWPLPVGGGDAPVGPGTGEVWVSAGPAYEALELGEITVDGVTSIDAVLPRAVGPATLAQLGLVGWPDPSERRRAADLSAAAVARGVGFAVLAAEDEIAPASVEGHDANGILVEGGSAPRGEDVGALLAWPWSANGRLPAHGAADVDLLDAPSMIDYLEMGAGRLVLVEPEWIEAAGAPVAWSRAPHGVALSGLDELGPWFDALDAWQPLAATGPLTWLLDLSVEGSSTVDADRAIVEYRTVAGNGPMIALLVDGEGPGGQVAARTLHTVQLVVQAPAWMDLREAALYSTGGVELGRWPITERDGDRLTLRLRTPLPEGWLVAAAWGEASAPPLLHEAPWAVTSPVWVGTP